MNNLLYKDFLNHPNSNSIAEMYLRNYPNLNYTVLIEANTNWLGEYYEKNYIRTSNWTNLVIALSCNYSGIGVLHTHQKISKGGSYHPHCHLALYVPVAEQGKFDATLKSRQRRVDRKRKFRIVDSTVSELDFTSTRMVQSTSKFVNYLFGENRLHLPKVIWEQG